MRPILLIERPSLIHHTIAGSTTTAPIQVLYDGTACTSTAQGWSSLCTWVTMTGSIFGPTQCPQSRRGRRGGANTISSGASPGARACLTLFTRLHHISVVRSCSSPLSKSLSMDFIHVLGTTLHGHSHSAPVHNVYGSGTRIHFCAEAEVRST